MKHKHKGNIVMQQRILSRILSAALVGSVMAAAPTMAAAAAVKKTAVKMWLVEKGKGSIPAPGTENVFSLSSDPFVAFTVSSLTPAFCKANRPYLSIDVTLYKPGLCTFRVAVADTTRYTGSLDYSFTIPKSKQLGFRPLRILTYPDSIPTPATVGRIIIADLDVYMPYADAWSEKYGTPYQLLNSAPDVCGVSESISLNRMNIKVMPLAPGDCTITVLRPANDLYEEDRMTWPINVAGGAVAPAKSNQSITFASLSSPGIGQRVSLSATGGGSGNPVTFSSKTPALCTVEGNVLTALAAGACIVAADQAGNDKFVAAPQQAQTVNIVAADPVKTPQAITLGEVPSLRVGGTSILSATGGDSGNAVTFTSQTPAVCTVKGNVLTALAAGACIIAADQQGNDQFNAAAQQTKTVNIVAADPVKAPQAITLGEMPSLAVGGTSTLSATGGDSGNAVTFTSQTPAVCTVEGNVLTALTAGSCVVLAEQKGNDQYSDAPAKPLMIEVSEGNGGKTAQVVGMTRVATLAVGGTATLAAFGGDSGNPVRLSSLTPDVCTLNETTLTAVAVGNCTVAANQDGNDRFSPAAQATMDVVIVKEIYPYSVAVNITGDLTAQTITASINPASADSGKVGSEFLAAQLGEMVFLYGTGGWVQYTGADSVVALSSGALASHELTLLDNVDMSSLVGAQVIVGYGLGNSLAEAYAEMLKSNRAMNVYKVE